MIKPRSGPRPAESGEAGFDFGHGRTHCVLIDGDGLASGRTYMNRKPDENYSEKEATARFEAALKSALNTPHKPLKEKPRVKKAAKKKPKK